MTPPAAFTLLRQGRQVLLLHPGWEDVARRILGVSGEPPAPASGPVSGRGGSYPSYPLDEWGGRGILKHYRHGGLLAGLLGDLFFGLRRPIREFLLSERALRRGIPTSTLIAARVRPVAALFYRGDVLILEIPGSRDAGALLSSPPPAGPQRNRHVRSLAAAVRKMHDEGLVHADLNVKNLLVQTRGGDVAAYVVDLDRAAFRRGPLAPSARAASLLRLGRSFLKGGGDRLQASLPRRFLAAYTAGDPPARRRLGALLRTTPWSFHLHRLLWRARGAR